jgi:hypothetical protein
MVFRYWSDLYRFRISFVCLNSSDSGKSVSYRCVGFGGTGGVQLYGVGGTGGLKGAGSRVTCKRFNEARPIVLFGTN